MNDPSFKNIIIISIDNLRADCLASNSINLYKQKHNTEVQVDSSILDDIASQGTFFTQCISAAPYTSASHGALFTGMWPIRNNLYSFFNRKIKSTLIFEHAKKYGYHTIFQTDFPIILGPYLGLNSGVDDYFVEDELSALTRVTQKEKALGFFHFAGCHYPYGFHTLKFSGADYQNKVQELENRFKITYKDAPTESWSESFRSSQDNRLLVRYKRVIDNLYEHGKYDELFNLYLEGVNYFFKNRLSSFLDRVIDYIDHTSGLLVIFSDHGEEWNKQAHGHYNSLQKGVLTVPAIFYSPQRVKLQTINSAVRSIDVGATIIDLVSGGDAKRLDGTSLVPTVFNSDPVVSQSAFAQQWGGRETMREFEGFQKKTIKRGKLPKPLDQYLKQETIIWDGKQLLNRYNESCALVSSELLDDHEQQISSMKDIQTGTKKLKHYNSLLTNDADRSIAMRSEVGAQLRAMGYRVV